MFNQDSKQDILPETKPTVIPTQRGVKREWERHYSSPHSASYSQENREHKEDDKREAKRQHIGFAVPNWKNIKKSSRPDADRYLDYESVKIRNDCQSIVSTRERRLITMPLYTFSCNVLCMHKENDKKIFIPIEIGINAYTIEKGDMVEPYHVMIDAGPVPTRMFNKSADHSRDTHKISFIGHGGYPAGSRNDYKAIYKDMLKFTRPGERTILIADERDVEQAKGCIDWLYEKASAIDPDLPKPSSWTIIPLIEYVTCSYNYVYQSMLKNPKPHFALHYLLKMRMENSSWDYDGHLMCSYHRQEDKETKWCARNCAIRALKCVEGELEQIFSMYKEATETPADKQLEVAAEPQPPAISAEPAQPVPEVLAIQKAPSPVKKPAAIEEPLIIASLPYREP